MKKRLTIVLLLTILAIFFCIRNTRASISSLVQKRLYTITYKFTFNNKCLRDKIDIWMPFPPELKEQSVVDFKIYPKDVSKDLSYDPLYGTPILHIETHNNKYIKVIYVVKRKALRTNRALLHKVSYKSSILFKQFSFTPSNPSTQKIVHKIAVRVTKNDLNYINKVHDIYNFIISYLKYGHIPGSGRGDLAWLFKTREGSCVDYHSLFMALCSEIHVPTLFEIGMMFPPNKNSGIVTHYHSWVKFFIPKIGWIPVDVSEADKHPNLRKYYFGNLTSNRITLSMGRWIRVDNKRLNFFTNPIVKIANKNSQSYKLVITYKCKLY